MVVGTEHRALCPTLVFFRGFSVSGSMLKLIWSQAIMVLAVRKESFSKFTVTIELFVKKTCF